MQRLKKLREADCWKFERRMYEAYLELLEVNEQNGLSAIELYSGPNCFHATMDELRPQVEMQAKSADQRFRIAKRIAGSPGQSPDKLQERLEMLQREVKSLGEAKYACKAYKLMECLWSTVLTRVHNTIDEQELCRSINPDNIFKSTAPSESGSTLSRQCANGAVTSLIPRIGAYSSLPMDAIGPLENAVGPPQEIQYAEEVFLEMKELCERGSLCMFQVMMFEDLMLQERGALEKALPGRDRILRVSAYNRVVKSFNLSPVRTELEKHKLWKLKNDGKVFAPSCFIVSGDSGKHLFMPDKTLPSSTATLEEPRVPDETVASTSSPSSSSDGMEQFEATPSQELEPDLGELVGLCVSCISKEASYVVQECGHLVYCSTCRRKAVARHLNDSERCYKGSRGIIKRGELNNKELQRTKLRCPICREESVLVARELFGGRVFQV